VVASRILATAFAHEGKYAQAFPEFGVERRGTPTLAFIRVDDKPINLRCRIYEPDHIVVLDPTLIEVVDVTEGLKKGGWVIMNSMKKPHEFNLPNFRVATVDVTKIAMDHRIGSKVAPIVNTAILGAFSNITELVKLESIINAVEDLVPVKKAENIEAVKEAYNLSLK